MNWKLRKAFTGNNTSDVHTINGYIAAGEDNDFSVEVSPVGKEYPAPLVVSINDFGRPQNQVPGICNGIHTHTGAASGGGIAATTLTGTGSGGKFKYEFDTLGKLVLIEADDAGQGYRVDDKLCITTNEGHDIEFRLVEGSNATTVTVGMEATKPSKPVPFPVTKMRVADSTDRQVLIMDQRSRYVFPKPTPYLLDTYEGAAAAYSLRRLRSAYTGPAVRVRRESNNDELDIYFDGQGNLDTASLEAFCAGTNGFVKVWYDQGPGGNDATQDVATADQPKLYDSSTGVAVNSNGNASLYFDSTDKFENITSAISTLHSSFVVAEGTEDSRQVYGFGGALAYLNFEFAFWNDKLTATFIGDGGAFTPYKTTPLRDSLTHLFSQFYDAVDYEIYLDNTLDTSASETKTSTGALSIGARNSNPMYLTELVLYSSDQSGNRTGIETNINDFYNIY